MVPRKSEKSSGSRRNLFSSRHRPEPQAQASEPATPPAPSTEQLPPIRSVSPLRASVIFGVAGNVSHPESTQAGPVLPVRRELTLLERRLGSSFSRSIRLEPPPRSPLRLRNSPLAHQTTHPREVVSPIPTVPGGTSSSAQQSLAVESSRVPLEYTSSNRGTAEGEGRPSVETNRIAGSSVEPGNQPVGNHRTSVGAGGPDARGLVSDRSNSAHAPIPRTCSVTSPVALAEGSVQGRQHPSSGAKSEAEKAVPRGIVAQRTLHFELADTLERLESPSTPKTGIFPPFADFSDSSRSYSSAVRYRLANPGPLFQVSGGYRDQYSEPGTPTPATQQSFENPDTNPALVAGEQSPAEHEGRTLPEIIFESLRGESSDGEEFDRPADLKDPPSAPGVYSQIAAKSRYNEAYWSKKRKPIPMAFLNPNSNLSMTEHRREAIHLAKQQEANVKAKCARNNVDFPPYTFEELVGKGSFGRVYRCRQVETKKVVAIKVIDIDDADFAAVGVEAEEQIKDFNKEVRILKDLKESGVPNLNTIIEARSVHSQLWMVCEHVQGGSVKTLMRATHDKLQEKYIIPVAREVAKALAGLHKAGFMHRDVKAANILVHEVGAIQLCDFGIATHMTHHTDKRKTFIGTLHYMAPEIFVDDNDREYDFSVDTWAFGCSLYEMAVGRPPNTDLREPRQLQSRMRRLNKGIELPANEEYSGGLRKLVSEILVPDKDERLSMEDVVNHEYLEDTEISHPTESLREVIQEYYRWLMGGGNRLSLFVPFGARGAEEPDADDMPAEDWNFDVSSSFSKRMSTMFNIPDYSNVEVDFMPEAEIEDEDSLDSAIPEGSTIDKKNFELRVARGAEALGNIFDPTATDYRYEHKRDFVGVSAEAERRQSDLPLRQEDDRPYSIASNVIDLGDFDSEGYRAVDTAVKLADPATIRANRSSSKLSKEPTAEQPPPLPDTLDDYENAFNDTDRPATQDFSFPPKEWLQGAAATEDQETAGGPSTTDNKATKHKTMEWSFASAMAEAAETEDEGGAQDASTGLAGPSSNTPSRQPLLRSQTEVVTTRDLQEAAFIANETSRPGTAMSETDADPFHYDQQGPQPRFGNDMVPLALQTGLSTTEFYNSTLRSSSTSFSELGAPGPDLDPAAAVVATGPRRPSAGPPPAAVGASGGPIARGRGRGRGVPLLPGGVDFPDVPAPSAAVLGAAASSEVLEEELGGLLSGLVSGLAAAEAALGLEGGGSGGMNGEGL